MMNDKAKILIVDDVSINLDALEMILEEEYDVRRAEDGEQAIKMLEKKDCAYRMMLLDLIMPNVDGYGVLEYMSKNKLLNDTPVIVVTSENSKDVVNKAYALGAIDVLLKPYSPEVIRRRVKNVLSIYEREYKDLLTGAYNRKGFISEVGYILNSNSMDREYAVVFFDIKNFKAINSMFDLSGGDNVLKQFCFDIINCTVNPIVLARLESDHFVCLVERKKLDIEELSRKMDKTVHIGDKNMHIFAQCGIYYIEDKTNSISDMIDCAKLAKLHIDETTKPYAIFEPFMKMDYMGKAEVLADFEDSLERKDFVVYYQPVIEPSTDRIVSAEALVRWNHHEKGIIPPAMFVPLLEKSGYISRLDTYVLEEVSSFINGRRAKGLPTVPVSVNLSWMDFYDNGIVDTIMEMLKNNDIAADKIRLEVTETSYAALESNKEILLNRMKDFGAVILMDDFGNGYSSFGMLENYNFDILKIDMSFVRRIETNEKSRIIIQGIIDMCHRMGIKVVAEGAENNAQVDFLSQNGCDYVQGYYYSQPLPQDEFSDFIDLYINI